MLAKERENAILKMLEHSGAVTTSYLVNEFKVSVETIRKDLLNLENQGKLSRVHGGAVAKGDMKPFLKLTDRNKEFSKEKRALSKKACEFISEGDIIGVDAGSTALIFAQCIKENFSSLTVVTNSLGVFEILKDSKGFEVILCAGYYCESENAFCGSFTLDMLSRLHVKKSFVFPSAISFKFGICDYNRDIFEVQRKIMHISDEIYILADSSKYEKQALLKLDDMREDYFYITDRLLSEESIKLYKENGLKIFLG